MAKTDNVRDLMVDIADAIRAKKGTSDLINPQDFSKEIASIEGGGNGGSIGGESNDMYGAFCLESPAFGDNIIDYIVFDRDAHKVFQDLADNGYSDMNHYLDFSIDGDGNVNYQGNVVYRAMEDGMWGNANFSEPVKATDTIECVTYYYQSSGVGV